MTPSTEDAQAEPRDITNPENLIAWQATKIQRLTRDLEAAQKVVEWARKLCRNWRVAGITLIDPLAWDEGETLLSVFDAATVGQEQHH